MVNIAIIGIDGTGKSTLASALKKRIEECGRTAVIVKTKRKISEMYQGICRQYNVPVREEVKAATYYLDLLFEYSKMNEIHEDYCIWDRFFYCFDAYFSAEKIDVKQWNNIVTYLPEPDFIVYCHLDPLVAIKRIDLRGNRKEKETFSYLKKVQN